MGIVRKEIRPFNDFWINCKATILYSLIVTLGEEFRSLTYNNNYTYEVLCFPAPSGRWVNEVRLNPLQQELYETVLQDPITLRYEDEERACVEIREYLDRGRLVMVGVDLFYWIPHNMCYNKYHFEHYAIVNGYDSNKDTFYVMDTDNEGYKEFEIPSSHLLKAMMECTLPYDAIAYKLCEREELSDLIYSSKQVIKQAKKICKSINGVRKKDFFLMEDTDYAQGFYRDNCVMYLLQINCQMKANRLFFEYLIEDKKIDGLSDIYECVEKLEKEWTNIRNTVSKIYLKPECKMRMVEMNERIRQQFEEEQNIWKEVIRVFHSSPFVL